MKTVLRRRLSMVSGALGALLVVACGGSGGGATPIAVTPPAPAPPPPAEKAFTPVPNYEDEYEALFALDEVKTIRVVISEAEWNALLNDLDHNLRSELYRQADFYFGDDPATAEFVPQVGFRIRGNHFSRQRPEAGAGPHDPAASLVRTHFKIKFNAQFGKDEGAYGPPSYDIPQRAESKRRTFRGVRSLNLKVNRNDPTYLREVLSYDLFRRAGVHTARQAYTKLYIRIGDEPERYLGVYLMGEHVDKSWAKRRFTKNSYLFKCLYQDYGPADLSQGDRDHSATTGAIGEEITDPSYVGEDWRAYRPACDLKTKEDEFLDAEDALNDLIELLVGNPTQAQLEAAIDIPTLLKSQALNVFLGTWDDYWRNGNNYYLFFDELGGKWFFVPYDYDITFFDSIFGITGVESASFLNWGDDRLSGNPLLMERIMSFDAFREEYARYVRALYDPDEEMLDTASLAIRLDELSRIVAPHTVGYDALDDIPYHGDHSQIEAFVSGRIAHARGELGD